MAFPAPAPVSPYAQEFSDYLGRKVTISVTFNNTTRAITGGTVHRDAGCLFHSIVFGDPSDPKAPRASAPGSNAVNVSFTPAQFAALGFTTAEQAMSVQITAEP